MAAREAFNLYARGEATLNGDNLFTALRCCSVNPTSDEIMATTNEDDEMDLEAFMQVIADAKLAGSDGPNGQEEVMAAFRAYDVAGTGQIDAAELTHILTASGEELSSSEASAALKKFNGDYVAFVNALFAGVPKTSSGGGMGGGGGGGGKPKKKAAPAKKKAAPAAAADDDFGGGFGDGDDDGFGDDGDGDDFGF